MFLAVETGNQPPYEDWVLKIRRRLVVLPDTVEGLRRAVRQEAQGLAIVWDKFHAPKAMAYFEAWAAGDEPQGAPPHRLPTGQIVDVAANDRA